MGLLSLLVLTSALQQIVVPQIAETEIDSYEDSTEDTNHYPRNEKEDKKGFVDLTTVENNPNQVWPSPQISEKQPSANIDQFSHPEIYPQKLNFLSNEDKSYRSTPRFRKKISNYKDHKKRRVLSRMKLLNKGMFGMNDQESESENLFYPYRFHNQRANIPGILSGKQLKSMRQLQAKIKALREKHSSLKAQGYMVHYPKRYTTRNYLMDTYDNVNNGIGNKYPYILPDYSNENDDIKLIESPEQEDWASSNGNYISKIKNKAKIKALREKHSSIRAQGYLVSYPNMKIKINRLLGDYPFRDTNIIENYPFSPIIYKNKYNSTHNLRSTNFLQNNKKKLDFQNAQIRAKIKALREKHSSIKAQGYLMHYPNRGRKNFPKILNEYPYYDSASKENLYDILPNTNNDIMYDSLNSNNNNQKTRVGQQNAAKIKALREKHSSIRAQGYMVRNPNRMRDIYQDYILSEFNKDNSEYIDDPEYLLADDFNEEDDYNYNGIPIRENSKVYQSLKNSLFSKRRYLAKIKALREKHSNLRAQGYMVHYPFRGSMNTNTRFLQNSNENLNNYDKQDDELMYEDDMEDVSNNDYLTDKNDEYDSNIHLLLERSLPIHTDDESIQEKQDLYSSKEPSTLIANATEISSAEDRKFGHNFAGEIFQPKDFVMSKSRVKREDASIFSLNKYLKNKSDTEYINSYTYKIKLFKAQEENKVGKVMDDYDGEYKYVARYLSELKIKFETFDKDVLEYVQNVLPNYNPLLIAGLKTGLLPVYPDLHRRTEISNVPFIDCVNGERASFYGNLLNIDISLSASTVSTFLTIAKTNFGRANKTRLANKLVQHLKSIRYLINHAHTATEYLISNIYNKSLRYVPVVVEKYLNKCVSYPIYTPNLLYSYQMNYQHEPEKHTYNFTSSDQSNCNVSHFGRWYIEKLDIQIALNYVLYHSLVNICQRLKVSQNKANLIKHDYNYNDIHEQSIDTKVQINTKSNAYYNINSLPLVNISKIHDTYFNLNQSNIINDTYKSFPKYEYAYNPNLLYYVGNIFLKIIFLENWNKNIGVSNPPTIEYLNKSSSWDSIVYTIYEFLKTNRSYSSACIEDFEGINYYFNITEEISGYTISIINLKRCTEEANNLEYEYDIHHSEDIDSTNKITQNNTRSIILCEKCQPSIPYFKERYTQYKPNSIVGLFSILKTILGYSFSVRILQIGPIDFVNINQLFHMNDGLNWNLNKIKSMNFTKINNKVNSNINLKASRRQPNSNIENNNHTSINLKIITEEIKYNDSIKILDDGILDTISNRNKYLNSQNITGINKKLYNETILNTNYKSIIGKIPFKFEPANVSRQKFNNFSKKVTEIFLQKYPIKNMYFHLFPKTESKINTSLISDEHNNKKVNFEMKYKKNGLKINNILYSIVDQYIKVLMTHHLTDIYHPSNTPKIIDYVFKTELLKQNLVELRQNLQIGPTSQFENSDDHFINYCGYFSFIYGLRGYVFSIKRLKLHELNKENMYICQSTDSGKQKNEHINWKAVLILNINRNIQVENWSKSLSQSINEFIQFLVMKKNLHGYVSFIREHSGYKLYIKMLKLRPTNGKNVKDLNIIPLNVYSLIYNNVGEPLNLKIPFNNDDVSLMDKSFLRQKREVSGHYLTNNQNNSWYTDQYLPQTTYSSNFQKTIPLSLEHNKIESKPAFINKDSPNYNSKNLMHPKNPLNFEEDYNPIDDYNGHQIDPHGTFPYLNENIGKIRTHYRRYKGQFNLDNDYIDYRGLGTKENENYHDIGDTKEKYEENLERTTKPVYFPESDTVIPNVNQGRMEKKVC